MAKSKGGTVQASRRPGEVKVIPGRGTFVWQKRPNGTFGWVKVPSTGSESMAMASSTPRPSRVTPPTPLPTTAPSSGGGDAGGGAAAPPKPSVRERALASLTQRQPSYEGRYTDIGRRTGISYGRSDGGAASFGDVFGTPDTTGAAAGTGLVLRDALGRPIDMSLLGTDVYVPGAEQNVAGTSLGDLILKSRKAAAEAAESISGRGLGGGVAGAIRTATEKTASEGLSNLIRGFTEEVGGLQGEILADYLDAFKDIEEGDLSEFAAEPTPPSGGTGESGGTGGAGGGAGETGGSAGGGTKPSGNVLKFDDFSVDLGEGQRPPTKIEQKSLDNAISGVKKWKDIRTNPPRRTSPVFVWRGQKYSVTGVLKNGKWVYTLNPAKK